MIKLLVDTNVFSYIFRGDSQIREYVENNESFIDATIYIECLQGSKSKAEKRLIKNYLDGFPLIFISHDISKQAIRLIDAYSNSHGLLLPDALIAATAIENDLIVATYNVSDFKFIHGLKYTESLI